MVLLRDLQVDDLKAEVKRRRGRLTGNKADLIIQLTMSLMAEGHDPLTHHFNDVVRQSRPRPHRVASRHHRMVRPARIRLEVASRHHRHNRSPGRRQLTPSPPPTVRHRHNARPRPTPPREVQPTRRRVEFLAGGTDVSDDDVTNDNESDGDSEDDIDASMTEEERDLIAAALGIN